MDPGPLSRVPDGTTGPTGIPRWLELAAAGGALLVLSPVLAVVAAAVGLSSRGPVLFRQQRVGRFGRLFTMYKFRSMRIHTGGPQVTVKGDGRITLVGRLLRKAKLDELPELWNVVRGDMSLVGPRPEVPRYVDLANPLWILVLQCRPGISDPVTQLLRNEEELMTDVDGDPETFYRQKLQPAKLEGYVAYLQRRTIWSDIGVLLKSLVVTALPASAPPPSIDDVRRQTPGGDKNRTVIPPPTSG